MQMFFLRLFKFFIFTGSAKQNQHCRNWDGVDHNSLEQLYSWISANNHFIDDKKCPMECPVYQYKTQKYFNASLVEPFRRAEEHFSALCTIPCLPNKACNE